MPMKISAFKLKSFRYLAASLWMLLAWPLHAQSILVLGDSISAAFGMDPQSGWVHLLQKQVNHSSQETHHVINASISGATTGDGLARLPALLDEHQPNIVILELGGNDGLRGYPTSLMQKNLQRMIDLSRDMGAKVILAGIEIPPNYGPRYTRSFRDSFLRLNEANPDIAFVPFILKGIATNLQLMQKDRIHPTAEAQPHILNHIWPMLQPML